MILAVRLNWSLNNFAITSKETYGKENMSVKTRIAAGPLKSKAKKHIYIYKNLRSTYEQ